MSFEIEYFHERVLHDIESWPVDVLADCARLVELLIEMGRVSGFRTRGLSVTVCLSFRPRGRSGIGRAFYCFLVGKRVVVLHSFIKKSQETPDRELKLARKRMKEVSNG